MSFGAERENSQTAETLVQEFQKLAVDGRKFATEEEAAAEGWRIFFIWVVAREGKLTDCHLLCAQYLLANPGAVHDTLAVPTAIDLLSRSTAQNGEVGKLLHGINGEKERAKAQKFCQQMIELLQQRNSARSGSNS